MRLIKLTPFAITLFLASCITNAPKKKSEKEEALTVAISPSFAEKRAREIREKQPIKIADGLEIKLWAADTLAPDPIAMHVTNTGTVYYTRTNRQKNSEFDIRGHQNWMTPSIALQTVEDRKAFLRETFAPSKSKENSWVQDLNGDGVSDWQDLAVERDEIWKIEDSNKDGLADKSTRVFEGSNEEETDIAGALLIRDKDAFVAAGPDVWRLQDTDNNGTYDKKTSISHGYAVHIGFGGHGMSGLIEGPDGKIYWGIGDIGANITALDGKKYPYPNEGVIVRSNPDGSDFEVIASGLRNTHEFVFDQYGNIITSDNDGDHPTESERLMYVVDGLDAGWRANWQYGKYTDPKNNKYKVWMDEKLSIPHWEGQAAHILPPLQNFHNGPTGMQFNPGTGLGKAWLNKFFLVEFVGNISKSRIWAFDLKPKGASFELNSEKEIISGILPTGIKFGPQGDLFIADWINGWDTKNSGRIWKLDVTANENNMAVERKNTADLINQNFTNFEDTRLAELLANQDQRIRLKAQFALVARDVNGFKVFQKTLEESQNQLAKVHAIWGLGQLSKTKPRFATPLLACLEDTDPELLTQALKTLGEIRYPLALDKVSSHLMHVSARVRFYAAEAVGKLGNKTSIPALIKVLEDNNDTDIYLRHAVVMALSRLKAEEEMAVLVSNPNKALRLAAVLVLRRLHSEKVALFLKDKEENIATDAARAIHDDLSIPAALPSLVTCLNNSPFKNEPLIRRALSAAQRVGDEASLQEVLKYSKTPDVSDILRAEAIAILGTWAEPSVLDRVDGRYRGIVKRDAEPLKKSVKPYISSFFENNNSNSLIATFSLLSTLQIEDYNKKIFSIYETNIDNKVKAAAIEALGKLNYEGMERLIGQALDDKEAEIRTAAIGEVPRLNVSRESLKKITTPIFEKGTIKEKQKLIGSLAGMKTDLTRDVYMDLGKKKADGVLEKELWLELTEAIQKTGEEALIALVAVKNSVENWLEEFKDTLFGGSRGDGYNTFNYNSTAGCTRCHSMGSVGGSNVGPNLKGVGTRLSREQILESMIRPSNTLAIGYGSVSLKLKDGTEISGIITAENETELVLQTSDAEPTKIAISRIDKRENSPSSMPAMGDLLSKREIRDLIEFLSAQK
jgi:quinoprotein glucose dehydrogenase